MENRTRSKDGTWLVTNPDGTQDFVPRHALDKYDPINDMDELQQIARQLTQAGITVKGTKIQLIRKEK